jgi:hypothetical protein
VAVAAVTAAAVSGEGSLTNAAPALIETIALNHAPTNPIDKSVDDPDLNHNNNADTGSTTASQSPADDSCPPVEDTNHRHHRRNRRNSKSVAVDEVAEALVKAADVIVEQRNNAHYDPNDDQISHKGRKNSSSGDLADEKKLANTAETVEVSVRNSGGTTTKITKDKNGRLHITTEL